LSKSAGEKRRRTRGREGRTKVEDEDRVKVGDDAVGRLGGCLGSHVGRVDEGEAVKMGGSEARWSEEGSRWGELRFGVEGAEELCWS